MDITLTINNLKLRRDQVETTIFQGKAELKELDSKIKKAEKLLKQAEELDGDPKEKE